MDKKKTNITDSTVFGVGVVVIVIVSNSAAAVVIEAVAYNNNNNNGDIAIVYICMVP